MCRVCVFSTPRNTFDCARGSTMLITRLLLAHTHTEPHGHDGARAPLPPAAPRHHQGHGACVVYCLTCVVVWVCVAFVNQTHPVLLFHPPSTPQDASPLTTNPYAATTDTQTHTHTPTQTSQKNRSTSSSGSCPRGPTRWWPS